MPHSNQSLLKKICLLLLAVALNHRRVVGGVDSALPVAFIPKYKGLVFDQAKSGAYSAQSDISNSGKTAGKVEPFEALIPAISGVKQIDYVTQITEFGGYGSILLSNNADDDIAPACREASSSGVNVVTWDSPLPSGVPGGESMFVAPVNFDDTGKVLADMASDILGIEGGEYAILSASRKAANQNTWIESMELVVKKNPDKYGKLTRVEVAYGDDTEDLSYTEAKRLTEAHPNLKLIVSPTTVGIVQASKVMTDLGKCGTVKVTGLGLPSEMLDYTLSDCAPRFALWDFVDLGYLAYFAAYRLAARELEIKDGQTFEAGRLKTFTVNRDPTREDAYRVIMGEFTVYDKGNVEGAALYEAIQGDGDKATTDSFENRYFKKYMKKPLAIIPKVTGMISFFASAHVIWHVLSNGKRRREPTNRVLTGIAASGMLASFFGFFLSTWPIPSDTWLVWGNVGSKLTCIVQGFFFQAGISATPLYAGALTTVFALKVVLRLTQEKLVRIERYLHVFVNVFAWGTALAGLPLKLYNSADRIGSMCWIAEDPPYCSLRDNCERGKNAYLYRWIFLYAWVFIVLAYMTVCMIIVYFKVLEAEKASDRLRSDAGQAVIRGRSRKVALQGLYYVLAFIIPWVIGITLSILKEKTYGDITAKAPIVLEVVNAFVWPLGGFLNFLVYIRPAY